MATSIDSNSRSLPSTRHLLTALITTIATSTESNQEDSTTSSNPLLNATQNTKSALLTLHTLFPNDFLPALDLLDRGLVTRLVLVPEQAEDSVSMADVNDHQHFSLDDRRKTAAYHVRSAQQQKANPRLRHGSANQVFSGNTYDVRLTAWSCSCPAFSFAAFPSEVSERCEEAQALPRMESDVSIANDIDFPPEPERLFGGLTRGSDVPVCKHLLACVIAEHCEGFAGLVEEREVGREEIAGWAAGWGD